MPFAFLMEMLRLYTHFSAEQKQVGMELKAGSLYE